MPSAPRSDDNTTWAEEDDDFFNDLSRQPASRRTSEQDNGGTNDTEAQSSKAKRIACVLCRKRKLRCDGTKPSCGTCQRLTHDCSYDEVRKKSGPKRGYVKALEARLAQVETLLKTRDVSAEDDQDVQFVGANATAERTTADLNLGSDNVLKNVHFQDKDSGANPACGIAAHAPPMIDGKPAEMVSLGLEEPMPTQDVIDDLNRIYFEKIHPSMPLMHRPRFLAAMKNPEAFRPPVCLRYAMWCLAAAATDKYEQLQQHFYQRARKYVERDEMRGHGESIITIGHVQAWFLISSFEFKMTFFPRAWMSTGRASRLALMMGTHRVDGGGLDVKQCLPPPRDWIDAEERRRTFWMCFFEDRAASIGTGWPMSMDERDISTKLPVDEESFEKGIPKPSIFLKEALDPDGATKISPFGGVVVMSALFGRNLTHLHRPGPDDDETNLNGDFWRRHRNMDNILLNIVLSLPDHFRLPNGIETPNVVFTNMAIHTSTICLHQAAIFKADNARLPSNVSAESKIRCITAASEIASIMRMISHRDKNLANPFTTFCLYVAARVFVQYLKSRPNDHQIKASLHFLLTAMNAMKRRNPLTESFMVQLDVDLQSSGLEDSRALRTRLSKMDASSRYGKQPQAEYKSWEGEDVYEPPYKKPPTFGDLGLAKHTSPDQVSFATNPRQNKDSHPYGTYGKTPSFGPSPESEDIMDITNDIVDLSSADSLVNQSSRGSITSISPPSMHQETAQPSWDSYLNSDQAAVHLNDTQASNQSQFTESNYAFNDMDLNQPMSGIYVDPSIEMAAGMASFANNEWALPSAGPLMVPGGSDSLPGAKTGFTPEPTGLTPGPTGLTPGRPDDNLFNISEAEWTQMMDDPSLNLGWESTLADSSVFHWAESTTRKDGSSNWIG